jgi:hypothetical protein
VGVADVALVNTGSGDSKPLDTAPIDAAPIDAAPVDATPSHSKLPRKQPIEPQETRIVKTLNKKQKAP